MNRTFKLSRRAVCRGAQGIIVGLPFLEAMQPRPTQAATTLPKRIVFFYTSCGTVMQKWRPPAVGKNFTFTPILKPLDTPELRPYVSLVGGLKMGAAEMSGGNGHAAGMTSMLTCRTYKERKATEFGDVGWGGGISIDQELKKYVKGPRLASLELGIQTQNQYKNFYSYMSYGEGGGSANAVTSDDDPASVYRRVFATVPDGAATRSQLEKAINQRKSVLDFVREDMGALGQRLGAEDRARLDKHATLIRELESTLVLPDNICEKPASVMAPSGGLYRSANMPLVGKSQMDLLAQAFSCDITRIGTLQWSEAQSGTVYTDFIKGDWTKLGSETYHHGISHAGVAASGQTFGNMVVPSDVQAAANEKLTLINQWYCQQLAYFAKKLYDTPDVDGTRVLDNTVIVWVSEISEGPTHSFKNMPYVIVGSLGGTLKMGEFFDFQNKRNHNDLFVTLGQALGNPDFKTFGDPALVQGPLDALRT